MLPATVTFSHELTLHIYIYIHPFIISQRRMECRELHACQKDFNERTSPEEKKVFEIKRERGEDQTFIYILKLIYMSNHRADTLNNKKRDFICRKKIKFLSHSIALVS